MAYLTAAVVLVGVLCVLDLLLTFGVVRRLREHTTQLAGLAGGGLSMPATIAAAGERIGEFSAATVDGAAVNSSAIQPGTVVVFLSPGCGACEEQLPEVLAWAGGARSRPLLAVAVGAVPEDEVVTTLRAVAPVVAAEHDSEIVRAFAVAGFPAYAVVGPDRRIADSAFRWASFHERLERYSGPAPTGKSAGGGPRMADQHA